MGKPALRRPPGSGTAVEHALEVLRLVEGSKAGIGVAAIVKAAGASPSTVRRILVELERTGRVERVEDPGHAQRQVYRALGERSAADAPELLAAVAAMLALKSSSAVWGDLLDEQARRMLDSLSGKYGAQHARLLRSVIDHVGVGAAGRVRYRPEHMDVLLTFLEGATFGCAVRARYKAPWQARATTRLYAMDRLFPQDGALYLVLRPLSRTDGWSGVHALHRFRAADLERKVPVAPPPVQEAKSDDAWQGGEPVEATLRVKHDWLPYFEERTWFEASRSERTPDGDLLVTARFTDRVALFRFVLSQAPWLRIEAPKTLDRELKRLVGEIWAAPVDRKR